MGTTSYIQRVLKNLGVIMYTTAVAKKMMRLFECTPLFNINEPGNKIEIFNNDSFLNATEATQKSIMLKSSEAAYKSELDYPWELYFKRELKPMLEGKIALDLGCFTGGRGIAWHERYNLKHLSGIDVKQVFIDAANQFVSDRKVDAEYKLGISESLPYKDESFDVILSLDVFEHVQNLGETLKECHRVLKKGGRLFLVFPGYYQPLEHHLSYVTRTPFLQYCFSGQTLIKAYNEIVDERGEQAYWYKRSSPDLEPWEKCNTINGTTVSQFNSLIKELNWRVVMDVRNPIGSVGRAISDNKFIHLMSKLLIPLTLIPGTQELFIHRMTYVLEK